jgi:gliding motility-associated-like protein
MASGTETVSSPGASDPSFALTNYCEGASNSASNIVTAGGTFAFNPAATDGATIDATTGAITNGVGGTTYTVEYSLTGACPAKSTKTVTVIKTPIANFTANPTVADLSNPTVNFTNSSQNATSYSWNFGDGSAMDNNTNPTHTYPNTNAGTYTVILTVSNGGCTATKSATIQIDSLIIEYSVPNVFSPNGDGVNDEFIFISSLNLKSVKTTILNRWGNVVFTSNDINFKWNGKDNSGQNCTEGTYFYKMEIESLNNKKYQEHGFVTIQR